MTLSDLKAGQTILADAGFTCLKAGPHEVKADGSGLYVECSEGHHYLDGQKDEVGSLVGLSAS